MSLPIRFETGDRIVSDAKQIVPVRTGRLQNSIQVAETREGGLVIVALTSYASYVEFGTSRMFARPYLRPAIRKNLTHFVNAFFQRMRI